MSAPAIWIFFPFLAGAIILLFVQERHSAVIGGTIAVILSLTALIFPIDTALLVGTVSLKISASVQILGRSFIFSAADGPLLAIIYGVAALWFFGTQASGVANRFVSLGLMIVSLLTASIAVEPFLFAALLLEMSAMLVIPLLVPPYQKPKRGVIRFLIYQTLAMPFILFSGWMLAGVEASPGNIGLTTQAGTMLGLGFAFLLAIFPLYNWIPLLAEEASPYATGFLLWALPTFTVIFALDFFDRYAWLRTSPQLSSAVQFAGVFMVASGGMFAATQKHIGRMMGYTAIAETGLVILAMGIKSAEVVSVTFLLLIPRGLELAVWALGLSIIKREAFSLQFNEVQGFVRKYPVAVIAILTAHLSMTGFPLLAGFPPRLALSQELASQSLFVSFWVYAGLFGLLVGALRTMAVFVMAEENSGWALNESWVQAGMLGLGVIGLFVLGLAPQALLPLISNLPSIFEHIGQ
jgi:formate hydrogenlyase subunit 3/multisubunit Na+/H+ antiporter MnhD subunit